MWVVDNVRCGKVRKVWFNPPPSPRLAALDELTEALQTHYIPGILEQLQRTNILVQQFNQLERQGADLRAAGDYYVAYRPR